MKSLFIVALLLAPVAANAQIISGSNITDAGVGSLTFDTSTSTYWAQFGVGGTESDGAYQSSISLVNTSSAGTGLVTVSAPVQANNSPDAEATEVSSGITVAYANGVGPVSSTNDSGAYYNNLFGYGYDAPAGQFSVITGYDFGGSNPTSGQSLTFTLNFLQAVNSATIAVAANDYDASSTLKFSFSNGATLSLNDPTPISAGNDNAIYYISVGNVPVNSVLTISDTLTDSLGGFANISLSGVSITVPEPSTYALLGLGMAGLFFLGRFRKLSS